jgi:ATP-dependent helicase HrpA
VRFHDQVGEDTLVKLMTDGVLLAEMQRDRDLTAYDTIILDEAHERSLNIDFLLGLLKQLLARRPDLKLVITSATIDPQRFADHFGGAPVLEVSGRSFPVEVRYRPVVDEDVDQVQAVVQAVDELSDEGPGDVLVFLSGEREIRDTADALKGAVPEGTEVVPLFARLSAPSSTGSSRRTRAAGRAGDQRRRDLAHRAGHPLRRRPRHRPHQPLQPAHQGAAAADRGDQPGLGDPARRPLRPVAPGICIRLYEEEDLLARPEFTDPEILRTNLASVILQMTALGLGDVEAFPFVDPPDRRNVKDGVDLLVELGRARPGAEDPRKRPDADRPQARPAADRPAARADGAGRRRQRLRAGRPGHRRGAVHPGPSRAPAGPPAAAAEAHNRFADETSDFLAYLNLWRYLQDSQKELSSSAFRRLCKKEYLNYLRVREWQDLHSQLRRSLRQLELSLDSSATNADAVHLSLLAGLLSHVGLRDTEKREYLGARSARWALVPSRRWPRRRRAG